MRIYYRVEKKRHSITIESRTRALITGVEKVTDSCATAINMVTSDGPLTVRGSELKINSFSVEGGDLAFEGKIDRFEYASAKKPLLRRIFK